MIWRIITVCVLEFWNLQYWWQTVPQWATLFCHKTEEVCDLWQILWVLNVWIRNFIKRNPLMWHYWEWLHGFFLQRYVSFLFLTQYIKTAQLYRGGQNSFCLMFSFILVKRKTTQSLNTVLVTTSYIKPNRERESYTKLFSSSQLKRKKSLWNHFQSVPITLLALVGKEKSCMWMRLWFRNWFFELRKCCWCKMICFIINLQFTSYAA